MCRHYGENNQYVFKCGEPSCAFQQACDLNDQIQEMKTMAKRKEDLTMEAERKREQDKNTLIKQLEVYDKQNEQDQMNAKYVANALKTNLFSQPDFASLSCGASTFDCKSSEPPKVKRAVLFADNPQVQQFSDEMQIYDDDDDDCEENNYTSSTLTLPKVTTVRRRSITQPMFHRNGMAIGSAKSYSLTGESDSVQLKSILAPQAKGKKKDIKGKGRAC